MLKLFMSFMVAVHGMVVLAQPTTQHGSGGSGSLGGRVSMTAYDPRADTRFYCGLAAVEHISREAFGWYDEYASVHLQITVPVTVGDETAGGMNTVAQSFNIYFTSLAEIDSGSQASRRLAWSWSGLFEGPLGSYPCSGLMIQDGEILWCLPMIAFRDAGTAYELYEFFSDMGSRSTCALDEIARYTQEQNQLDLEACMAEGEAFCVATLGVVGPTAVAACLSAPPTCVPGAGLILGVWIMRELWVHDIKHEWERSMRQLCLESRWRADHPNGPPPPTARGVFECKKPLRLAQ
ncbi:MAG: hypothetical protein KIT19_04380 [Phycisphaeraceae bacterium]|nr:hypothetical protein [Phycisphaeraceae bacterium]